MLKFTRREIVTLAAGYYDGRTDSEAARLHGISPGAVKQRRYRARRKAREHGVVIPPLRRARAILSLQSLPVAA